MQAPKPWGPPILWAPTLVDFQALLFGHQPFGATEPVNLGDLQLWDPQDLGALKPWGPLG
jgi:hypothetical protein